MKQIRMLVFVSIDGKKYYAGRIYKVGVDVSEELADQMIKSRHAEPFPTDYAELETASLEAPETAAMKKPKAKKSR